MSKVLFKVGEAAEGQEGKREERETKSEELRASEGLRDLYSLKVRCEECGRGLAEAAVGGQQGKGLTESTVQTKMSQSSFKQVDPKGTET